jgi:antitoxin component YwqK of YwqJK toxin-antitoxin module
MKNKLAFLAVVLFAIILSSCGSKLSRGKAGDIISAFYEYPNVEISNIKLESVGSNRNEGALQRAAQMGLMSNGYDEWAAYGQGSGNVYNPTSKGEMFIAGTQMGFYGMGALNAVTNCRTFNEVTRITENPQTNTAEVEFSCKRKGITPFGEVLGYKEGEVVNYKVVMTKSDDGWHITDQQSNVKPETYFFYNKDGDYNMTGVYKKVDKGGNLLAELNYKDGKLNGKSTAYYSGGQKKFEKEYKNDVADGAFVEYHESGQKKSEGVYVNNNKSGTIKDYSTSGKLERSLNFNDGVFDPNSLVLYNENGDKIDIGTYLIGSWKTEVYIGDWDVTFTLSFTSNTDYNIKLYSAHQMNASNFSTSTEIGTYTTGIDEKNMTYFVDRITTRVSEFENAREKYHRDVWTYNQDDHAWLVSLEKNKFVWKNYRGFFLGRNYRFYGGKELTFVRQ